MSVSDHRAQAPRHVTCAVLTVSDTRDETTDTGGAAILRLLGDAGHRVAIRQIVKDEPPAIRAFIQQQLDDSAIQAVIATGGTGISPRDRTIDAVRDLFEQELDGFGELFRMLSYQEVGPAAMLSRACAGVANQTLVFLLPGSERAVRLAMQKLIIPELGHLVREVSR